MIVDGKALAAAKQARLRQEITDWGKQITLTAFASEPTFETQKFLTLKQRFAEAIGVRLNIIECGSEISTTEAVWAIRRCIPRTNGIVVQLPFPKRFDLDELLTVIPPTHDVDALMYDGSDDEVLPPVVGAIKLIAAEHDVSFKGQQVTVVGNGRLVGAPAAMWAKQQGAVVTVVNETSPQKMAAIKAADILILGAGVPGLITKDMVREGVVIFDVGTLEVAGVLRGDTATDVADVAALFTPVPGGIGPITIACLFQNLLILAKRQ